MKTMALLTLALLIGGCHQPGSTDRHAPRKSLGSGARPAQDEEDDGDGDEGADEHEVVLAVDAIPVPIKNAARKAVPGLAITGAEREMEGGRMVYCVHGNADGEFVEVEIASDGSVLEIERGDDGDEDDD
jgi:uncharacterized membrane protein YkoI